MRILYFSRDYGPHDHRFLSGLAHSAHQVFYLRLERGARQTESRPVPEGVEQVAWSGGKRSVRLSDAPRLLWELRRIIRRIQPQVIHAGPIQSCALLAALAGAHPLLVMSWGFDLMKDAQRGAAWRWTTRHALAHADWFTSDCLATRDKALEYGMNPDCITVFPWGVDLTHFSPLPRPSQIGQVQGFTLLCNRSWEPNYGVDVLAKAFVTAARTHPELRLLLLGGGSQGARLRHIFTAGGVLDQVEFAGQISQADLPRFYRLTDVYVSPAHVDGSSVSLLEALACGLPCLVSDIPANREWVQTDQNGWLFPDEDSGALARRILQAMQDRSALGKLGAGSRRVAEARADWNENFGKLLWIYEKIGKKD